MPESLPLTVLPEVADALAERRPVVALESTLVTHGLPLPRNLEVARLAETRVREAGAVPATVAIHAGRIRAGLHPHELEELASVRDAPKVTRQNLAWALGRPGWGGTTVSATMIAAHLAGIAVFATGGIGGAHRGATRTFDISADLEELARTPVAVVCAGAKSILDVALTLEILETRGVPVVGIGTDEMPWFWSRSSGLPVPTSVPTPAAAAALVARHRALGLGSGVVLAVPVPEAAEVPADEARPAIEQAVRAAESAGIRGPASTPWILARVAERTDGRTVAANVALIAHNAEVAAGVAAALIEEERR